VTGYVAENEFAEETLQKLGEALGTLRLQGIEASLSSRLLDEEDWAESWKEFFYPEKLGERIVVKPSWRTYDAGQGDIIIELDPGMAFGTGTHATTRLCLEALERIFDCLPPYTTPFPQAPAVLDVGTGSGVLAIAARKLGAGPITAVDIDPDAVAVAQENLALNGIVDDVDISTTPLARIHETFSLVLANILAEDLIRMAGELTERLRPGGLLILSGILVEREPGVMDAFSRTGLTLMETMHQQEWSCLVYRREH
jgi:ribosomal protein L11 methyltransferase